MSDDSWYGTDPLEPNAGSDPYGSGRRAAPGRQTGQYPHEQTQSQYQQSPYPQVHPAASQQAYYDDSERAARPDYSNPQGYQQAQGQPGAGRRRQAAPPAADPYASGSYEYPARGSARPERGPASRESYDGYSSGGYPVVSDGDPRQETGAYSTGAYSTGGQVRPSRPSQDPYEWRDTGSFERGDSGSYTRSAALSAPPSGGRRRAGAAAEEPVADEYPSRPRSRSASGSDADPYDGSRRSRRRDSAAHDDEANGRFDLLDDDDTSDGRRGRKPKQKKGRNCLAVFMAFAVLAGGLAYAGYSAYTWYQNKYGPAPDFASATGIDATVDITIPTGAGGRTIGAVLFKADVVKSQRAFTDACNANTQCVNIQASTYLLHKEMSAAAAVTALLDVKNIDKKGQLVTFGGERAATIFASLESKTGWTDADVQAAIATGDIGLPAWDTAKPGAKFPYARIEGFIASETYTLSEYTNPAVLLKKMVGDQLAMFVSEGLADKAKASGYSEYKLLIIASMARAEAGGNAADLNKIAGVIFNRLKSVSFQHLGFDTVTLYGMGNTTTKPDNLDKSNQYNTSVNGIIGLPPGPIDNPDQKAIDAALNPNDKTDLYFCAYDDAGDTAYAVTKAQWAALGKQYPGKCG